MSNVYGFMTLIVVVVLVMLFAGEEAVRPAKVTVTPR